jgi:hypothetical protein
MPIGCRNYGRLQFISPPISKDWGETMINVWFLPILLKKSFFFLVLKTLASLANSRFIRTEKQW